MDEATVVPLLDEGRGGSARPVAPGEARALEVGA